MATLEREGGKAIRRWRMTRRRRRPSSPSVATASSLLLAVLLIVSAPLSSLSSSEAPAVEQQPPEGASESPEMSTTSLLDNIVDGTCLDYRKAGEYWSYRWCHERNVSKWWASRANKYCEKEALEHHHQSKAPIKGTKCARLFTLASVSLRMSAARYAPHWLYATLFPPPRPASSASILFSLRVFFHVPGHSSLLPSARLLRAHR